MKKQEKMEMEKIENELSSLIEITLRLEDELNSFIKIDDE